MNSNEMLKKSPFIFGMTSLFDFTGSLNRERIAQILDKSDSESIYQDFEVVGKDLQWAMNEFSKKQ